MTVINCDMGEAFGLYRMGDDAGLMPLIDVANVACGFHASDFNHMRATVQLAKRHGVKVWPDRYFVPNAMRDYCMFAVPSSVGGGAMVTGAGGR